MADKASQETVGSKPDTQPENEDEAGAGVIFGEDSPDDVESFWDEEAERLGQSSDWFKPEPGTSEVTFLDEGKDDTREYEGETRQVRVFSVEVDGEEMLWSVTKGRSESSLYGQLVKVAQSEGGLSGVTVSLIRSGTGTDTQYTVQEAADL